MIPNKIRYAAVLAASIGFVASVSAQVTVSTSASAPTESVIVSVNPTTAGTNYSWNAAVQMGQSFLAPNNGTMEGFTLRTGSFTSTNALITLKIYQAEILLDGPVDGELVYEKQGNLPASSPNPGYMTFTLDAPVSLSSGKYYIFTLNYSSTSQAGTLGIFRGTGADSSKYWSSSDAGASFTPNVNQGYLSVEGTLVPEPSAAVLLVPGIAVLLYGLRKKTAVS